MSDVPRHSRLDPLGDTSEMIAPPSYEEVAAGASTAGQRYSPAAVPRRQEPTRRQNPQPPSSPPTTTTSSSLAHRQHHQRYTSLFSPPAFPANAQHYSSLLPPVTSPAEASPGIPPNYDVVTSSIPDRFCRRRRAPPEILPEGERDIDTERARILQAEKGVRKRWGRNPPPKPEGVPLEEVCDRFGNRKRELKLRSTRDIMLDPPSVRKALSHVRFWY